MQKEDRIKQYDERYRNWNSHVINQFGFTINLFTTIGIGFLSFLISLNKNYPKVEIKLKSDIDWNLCFYLMVLTFITLLIILGAISIITRLYDLRLTRHLIITRKKVFIKFDKLLPNKYINLENESIFNFFLDVVVGRINFIGDLEKTDLESIKFKFEKLRKQSKILGRISWSTHKTQIVMIVLTMITYLLTVF